MVKRNLRSILCALVKHRMLKHGSINTVWLKVTKSEQYKCKSPHEK